MNVEQLDVDRELPPPEAHAEADTNKVTAERDALLDRAARLQAELENARKRAAREQEEQKESTLADALKSLLPILDSMDQALQAPGKDLEDFRRGIELIQRQFHDALSSLGVVPIQTTSEAFDPRFHEAIEMVETPNAEDNRVLDELQRGYKFRDRLLRPSRVRVARNPKE